MKPVSINNKNFLYKNVIMTSKLFVTTLPDFLLIQRSSFIWFLIFGLKNEIELFKPFLSSNLSSKRFNFRFFSNEILLRKQKDVDINFCKMNKFTYSIGIFLPIQMRHSKSSGLLNHSTFIGKLPLMTRNCSFIINGYERVIINQIVRSPGLYSSIQVIKKKQTLILTLVPERGFWIKFLYDDLGCRINFDKTFETSILYFLDILGVKEEEITKIIQFNSVLQEQKKMDEIIKKQEEEERKKMEEIIKAEQEEDDEEISFLENIKGIKNNEEIKTLFLNLLNEKYYFLGKVGRLNLNQRLGIRVPINQQKLTIHDIFGIINYFLKVDTFLIDDIDDLKNRRIRSIGELLQIQFKIGLLRLERNITEKIDLNKKKKLSRPSDFFDPKIITSANKEFFSCSSLSHFMQQSNVLSELSNKRRISALGPGGFNGDRVSVMVRDIHPSQYGRICPIETPEGSTVGLTTSFACYSKIDSNGFIKTPYFRVKEGKVMNLEPPIYLKSEEEEFFKIASIDCLINENGYIDNDFVIAKFQKEFILIPKKEINYISVSPIQILSIGTALTPFLEHNDANRILMGSNMQRQAVPLLYSRKPIIGTGLEQQIANDSGLFIFSLKAGLVKFVSSEEIIIKNFDNSEINYKLNKYERSNQETCLNQKPIVWLGEEIKQGQIIADAPGTDQTELALGQNLTVAYMSWEGFNFEDSIVISDRLIYQNLFTSIHIEKCQTEVKKTKSEKEILTTKIPFLENKDIINLDSTGIIRKGSFVKPDDILIGKIINYNPSHFDLIPEARLLKAIFGSKIFNTRDVSFRVPPGIFGRVIHVQKLVDDSKTYWFQIFIAKKKNIKVGDKIAGRHGNKGIISKILAHQDMPFLPDGSVIDIILNPLGVPSRMNVGQVYECLLGLAADYLNKRYLILPFDEIYQYEASRILINQKLLEAAKKTKKSWLYNPYSIGKILLTDGRTGEKFKNPILVGRSYILKLIHMIDEKIYARSTGKYSLITQQPVGGKALLGGQRFGEMEVWALEAYGSAYTLQELLTIKSDDIQGRTDLYSSIVFGKSIPKGGLPESFKVLMSELQSLGLDIRTHKLSIDKKNTIKKVEVDLMKTYEYKKNASRKRILSNRKISTRKISTKKIINKLKAE